MRGGVAMVISLACVVPLLLAPPAAAFESWQLDLYDLVEEVGESFYAVLGVDAHATDKEIKRAFRKLSVKLHPDKNPEPDAAEQFRRLAEVSNILTDANKRAHYDDVLANGLPSWRSPVFYYREAKKIPVAILVPVALAFSCGVHALVLWLGYRERARAVAARLEKALRKDRPQGAGGVAWLRESVADGVSREVPRPGVLDLWPFRVLMWLPSVPGKLWVVAVCAWDALFDNSGAGGEGGGFEGARKRWHRTRAEPVEELVPLPAVGVAPVAAQPAVGRVQPEGDNGEQRSGRDRADGPWDAEELRRLVKACKKHVGGRANRWQLIADEVGRDVKDTIAKAKEIGVSIAGQQDMKKRLVAAVQGAVQGAAATEGLKNDNDAGGGGGGGGGGVVQRKGEAVWTQDQQRQLEQSLRHYPAAKYGSVATRWAAIAQDVPGKSAAQCLARYRELCEQVRQRSVAK